MALHCQGIDLCFFAAFGIQVSPELVAQLDPIAVDASILVFIRNAQRLETLQRRTPKISQLRTTPL